MTGVNFNYLLGNIPFIGNKFFTALSASQMKVAVVATAIFGAIALIYSIYKKYNNKQVQSHTVIPAHIVQEGDKVKLFDFLNKYSKEIHRVNLSQFHNLNNRDIRQIVSLLPNLTHLTIHSSFVTDAGIEYIQTLKHLKHLNLRGCDKISDEGLSNLSAITTLHILGLSGCNRITDAGLAHLPPLVELRGLDLSGCDKLTSTGLKHLKQLPSLEKLDLTGCDKILEPVSELTISIKDDGKSVDQKFLIFEAYRIDKTDAVIKDCVSKTFEKYNREPTDFDIKIHMDLS